ncbi:MAG: DUF4157 domain-containing protein [Calothrix sp. C42_A2020_038]|nr:DUF4157 domain-containing protein [Calothrix sp. C42_A2020_038]
MNRQTATQTKPTTSPLSSAILQRQCNSCGQKTVVGGECAECQKNKPLLQRLASSQAEVGEVPPIVHEVLNSFGKPLDETTRTFMESRFGQDFSTVRVHTDTQAAESAQAVNALAYTVGRDIVFGTGQYAPGTHAGKRLLAHELTHVVQQNATAQMQTMALEIATSEDVYEQEAETVATQIVGGDSVRVQGSLSSSSIRRLQRQRRQDTHAGVFEMTQHAPLGGPTFSPQAQYNVRLEFLPYPVVDCERIAMTQTVVSTYAGNLVYGSTARRDRSLTAAEGTEGVGIDRLSGRSQPYYGTNNAGNTAGIAHFGSRTAGNRPDRAWIEDTPGFDGSNPASSRTAGDTMSQQFETCAICTQGRDINAYYGCVSWGFNIDVSNNFTESAFALVSRGTPSADFLAAARKWNAQTTPVATTDLPIPSHTTHNTHMTRNELNAEITSLETRLRGLPAGHADIPQITFELRALRDIRDAIRYNEDQGYLRLEIRMIQAKVGALQDGIWGYDTVRRVKLWQAVHGLVADGRVGPITLERMGINRVGDYPLPDTSPTATRVV